MEFTGWCRDEAERAKSIQDEIWRFIFPAPLRAPWATNKSTVGAIENSPGRSPGLPRTQSWVSIGDRKVVESRRDD
jgi:hypothetical protein